MTQPEVSNNLRSSKKERALKPEEVKNLPTVKESILYERLRNDKVKCGICERRCIIPPNSTGFCRTKMNIDGKLYTIVYGDISALSANPIEKKPFFHFWPGSIALTFSTWSCNFTCPWCQNFHLSTIPPNPEKANYISPEEMVKYALLEGCDGLSVSFQEPTLLFEYSLDLFPIAKQKGLYTNYVSNGYMTEKALEMLKNAGMDAIKFDVKGDEESVKQYCAADVNIVWRNIRKAKELGMHVEVVNLVITEVNDDEECLKSIIERHLKEAGPDTPLHFTKYYPSYKFRKPATPTKTLEKAYLMARKEGVSYPYIGNVPGHPFENTYCHNCGEVLIKRFGFEILEYKIHNGRCEKCHEEIPIVGYYVKSRAKRWLWL